jgi:hypothetical protein
MRVIGSSSAMTLDAPEAALSPQGTRSKSQNPTGGGCYSLWARQRRTPATTNPLPSRSKVVGSGTGGAVWLTLQASVGPWNIPSRGLSDVVY